MILGHCFDWYEKESKKKEERKEASPFFQLVDQIVSKMDYTTNQLKVARTETEKKKKKNLSLGSTRFILESLTDWQASWRYYLAYYNIYDVYTVYKYCTSHVSVCEWYIN
jgi:hypothetical protein